jgi:aryl-alcohol dehydrogenase-like predicted oxidoreductase
VPIRVGSPATTKDLEAVQQLADLAATKGATVSELALAWLLAQGEHIVPIPGTRRISRVEENAAAADLALTDTDLAPSATSCPPADTAPATAAHLPTWI